MPAGEVVKNLEVLAKVLGATLPDEDGIEGYVLTLQTVGHVPLKHGLRMVMATHKFPSLPVPAEILEAGMERQRILKVFEHRFDTALFKLR
jgi:hypothetical protein